MLFNSFSELFVKGGYTLVVLIFCSVISLGVIINKFVALKAIAEKKMEELKNAIIKTLRSSDHKEALYQCKLANTKWLTFYIHSPLANIYHYILENSKMEKDELLGAAYTRLDKEVVKMEKGLGILATLGSISPFIGLFGTVIGIIRSFQALSLNETAGYSGVMAGIAEALVSTAAGLLVAVPAVIFYNYFMKKIKLSLPTFEEAIQELVREVNKN